MVNKLNNQFLCSRMMLPEHVRELRKQAYEAEIQEISKIPELDEQRLEEMDKILKKAIKKNLPVRITVMNPKGPNIYKGKVKIERGKAILMEQSITIDLSKVINIEEI